MEIVDQIIDHLQNSESAKRPPLSSLIICLSIGLSIGLTVRLIEGLSRGLIVGLISGLVAGLHGGSNRGGSDVIMHYALRLILWRSGYTPFNFVKFLDQWAKLILLKKAGGSYIFIHRMLLEYFADLPTIKKSGGFKRG